MYRLPVFVQVAENVKVRHTPQLFHSLKLILSIVASTIEILILASLLSMYGNGLNYMVNQYTIKRGGSANQVSVTSNQRKKSDP